MAEPLPPASPAVSSESGPSPAALAWRRLGKNRPAMLSIWIMGLILLAAAVGPMLVPEANRDVSRAQYMAPSWEHPMGTDLLGRDVLYRVLVGARVSLAVGIAGAFISLIIGTTYGMVAGYFGGRIDAAMMRFVDIFYAIPRVILILFFVNTFESAFQTWLAERTQGTAMAWTIQYAKILLLIVSLGFIEWLTMARVVRGQVLAVKSQQYVLAARSLGQSHFAILFRHVLPNIAGIVVVYLTLTIPAVILDESFLSFLGLGADASNASWGTLLKDGKDELNPVRANWWLLLFPAVAMSLTLLALNFIGDGLRDAFDPRGKR